MIQTVSHEDIRQTARNKNSNEKQALESIMELVKEKKGGMYNSGRAHDTFASDDFLRKRARDRSGKPEAGRLCVRRTCNGKPGGLAFRLAMPLTTFALLFSLHLMGFSQILGEWKIIKYQSEVSGLSVKERKSIQLSIEGQSASIKENVIVLNDITLDGLLQTEFKNIRIVDAFTLPDSLSSYVKFFCQEITYFDVVTRETIDFIKKNFNQQYLRVTYFQCSDNSTCVYIYSFSPSIIAACVPGDGVYLLNKKTANSKTKNKKIILDAGSPIQSLGCAE